MRMFLVNKVQCATITMCTRLAHKTITKPLIFMTENTVSPKFRALLSKVNDPVFDFSLLDAVEAGNIAVDPQDPDAGESCLVLQYPFPIEQHQADLLLQVENAQQNLAADKMLSLKFSWSVKAHAVQQHLKPLSGIKNIIAIASGKGGVGKSTTAVNVALALAKEGAAVGLLDADIYGPSIPSMLGLSGQKPESLDEKSFEPMQAHGIKCMSIGFLVGEDQPMVWRGPMVTQALTQLLMDTNWGELDYLIVDMPPGTGDLQLTLSQRVPLSGAAIVTTPQNIALLDAKKGLQMFRKVNVKILGIVENMAAFVCPHCNQESAIFGSHGGQSMAKDYDTNLLGSIPLATRIREETDKGLPTVVSEPDSVIAKAYQKVALKILAELAASQKDYSSLFPKIVVENT